MSASDRDGFEEFMTSRWAGLVRLAFGLTGDRWLAEDLAQTALANAYAAWWRVRRADDPDAYVRRILINASRSRFRRGRVREQPRTPAEAAGAAGTGAEADPAAAVAERSALLAALASLPPRQRAVVVLRYWEDLTDAQAGALLGCSASTVRSQAARALAKLRADAALADTARPGPPAREAGTPQAPGRTPQQAAAPRRRDCAGPGAAPGTPVPPEAREARQGRPPAREAGK